VGFVNVKYAPHLHLGTKFVRKKLGNLRYIYIYIIFFFFFFELIQLSLWVMLHISTLISFWKYQLPIGSKVGKLSFTGSFESLGRKKIIFFLIPKLSTDL
jgi:hypothetical protein